jgi:phenylacetate-CoA ligase
MHKRSEPAEILRLIEEGAAAEWRTLRETRALELFHRAAAEVPAYRDFLAKRHVDPSKVTTFADFEAVPPTSKQEYLRQYSPQELAWPGAWQGPLVWTSTSGSTGEPFYFPRSEKLDWQYSILAELFLRRSRAEGPTLIIVAFGMGVWIGGLITYKAFEMAAARTGKAVSIITPGVNKGEIFHALRKLAPNFRQTVLVGYPPFVKDVLDEAVLQGIDLAGLDLRLMFAAEAFTEKFRDNLVLTAHVKDPCLDTLNVYGTADIGAMAFETPASIFIRRRAMRDPMLFTTMFASQGKTPTLAQYDPHFITFEAPEGEVLLTGDNAYPLIRYAPGDRGGTLDWSQVEIGFHGEGQDLRRMLAVAGIPKYEMPFVFVYERSDLSTKLYGAIIYPEHVREALQHDSFAGVLTGKFTMLTKFDEAQHQYLEVNLELKPGTEPSRALAAQCREAVLENLRAKNSEYANNFSSMGEKVAPVIKFWPHEDPLYFRAGIKQKWVVQ